MALYIAVCDDNIADRKQFERLLNREREERLCKSQILYVEVFGNLEALMMTPIKYDLFFIDVTNGLDTPTTQTVTGMDIAKKLRTLGITSPIVLCSSFIDYTAYGSPAKDITYLTKPVTIGQLSHLIDVAFEKQKTREPLIEIRGEKDTCYVPRHDIIYAKKKGLVVEVCLSNSRFITMYGNLKSFLHLLPDASAFGMCGTNCLVHFAHVSDIKKNAFVLDNKDVIPFYLWQKPSLIKALLNHRLKS